MLGSQGLIFVVFLCDKNGITVLSFSGRMLHRRLAVSPPPYDIGIKGQKDNPMLKTHKIALDPKVPLLTEFDIDKPIASVYHNRSHPIFSLS